MLHDTWNIYMFSITDTIDFKFFTYDIFIDKDWCIMTNFFYSCCHIDFQIIIIVYDFHCTSTQYITWTNKHWITDTIRDDKCFFHRCRSCAIWLRDI